MTAALRSTAFIGIGGNVGDRLATLRSAVAAIAGPQVPTTTVVAASSLYETLPVGPSSDRFLNAVLELSTELQPEALLDALLAVEAAHGRSRRLRWGPRTVDLDVLAWLSPDGAPRTIATARLDVPHPCATERDFVLVPLADVSGGRAVLAGRTAASWLAQLPESEATIVQRWPDRLLSPESR